MRKTFVLAALLLLSRGALAQFTTVTGTVTDPNGLAYAYGTITPTLVISSSPKFTSSNQPYTPPTQSVGLNSAGAFVMQLADVTTLTPGGGTWSFSVCSGPGSVNPAFGKGPVCFTVTGITISGGSQSLTSTLSAAAPALTASFSGGSALPNCPDTSGSATAQSCTLSGSATLTTSTPCFSYTTTTPNSGALTIAVNGGSALPVHKWLGSALVAGDMPANVSEVLCYDGTNLNTSTIGNAPGGIAGSGTAGQVPLWSNSSTQGNSVISQINIAGPGSGQGVVIAGNGLASPLNSTGAFEVESTTANTCANASTFPIPMSATFPCFGGFIAFLPTSTNSQSTTVAFMASNAAGSHFSEAANFTAQGNNTGINEIRGVEADVSSGGTAVAGALRAGVFYSVNNGTGTTPTNQALYAIAGTGTATATTTNNYGLYVDSPFFSGASTLTNNYGIYIADQSVTGVSGINFNPFALYTAGSAPSRLGGALTIIGALTTNITGGGIQCLHASNTGVVTGTGSDCGSGGGGAVTSVSNSDGTLTISPTAGAVVASLNTAHGNTWTAAQTIGNGGSVAPSGTGTVQANQVSEPPVYFTNDQTGADLCAKITTALLQCPTGTNNTCRIIVQSTTPGSVDVCSAGTSDFWAGVTPRIVEFDWQAQLDVKKTINFPFTPHFVHGAGSNQSMTGGAIILDNSSFTSTTLFANNSSTLLSGEGPSALAGQAMKVLISDGGRTSGSAINQWQQNASGAVWENIRLDCNNVALCIPYYTASEQEKSRYINVAIWNQGTTCTTAGCNYSIGMFFDHYAAQTGNFGPSHFHVENSGVNAFENTTGTSPNQTIFGIVVEGANCPPATCTVTGGNAAATGGNISIVGGTIRGAASNQLLQDAIWIDGTTNNVIGNIHCEWMSAFCVETAAGGNATTSTFMYGISDVNHAVPAVHLGATSIQTIVEQSDNGITDDANGCNPAVNVDSYSQAVGGSGYWSAVYHARCALLFSTSLADFSGFPQFKMPVAGAYTSAANGEIGYDSANLNWHLWANGVDNLAALFPTSTSITNSDCVKWIKVGTVTTLGDAGAACGSSGGSPAGSQYDLQTNAGGGNFGAVATHSAATGAQVTANNSGPPTANNPALTDSPNSPVLSGGAYTFACPTSTALGDDATTFAFQSGANTSPLVPSSVATGCSGVVIRVAIESGGPFTFGRSGSDTFTIYTGGPVLTSQTSFTVCTGQTFFLNQSSALTWKVWVNGGPCVYKDTSSSVAVSASIAVENHNNQNATAGAAITYTLPTAAAGYEKCFVNSFNGSAANTGTLEILTSASGQFIIFTDGTLSATGGFVQSGGAAHDSACVKGVDATHWQLFTQSGTWTKH